MCNPPQSPPKAASRRSPTNHNTNMNTASPASMPVATAASLPDNHQSNGTAAPSSLKLELAMHRNNASTTNHSSNTNSSSRTTRTIHVRQESRDEGIDNNSFDDEHDIPDLVDEDDVCDSWDEFPTRGSLPAAITPPPQIPKPQRLSITRSLPLAPQKAKARTRSATTSKKQQAKRDDALPFFCLDCMIEDLVPNKDQKARQDLARILNNNCNNHTHKQRKSPSLPRSTTSEPNFHTNEQEDEPETPIRTPQYPLPELPSSATATTSKHFSFDESPLPAVGSADSALSPTNTNTASATTPPPPQPTTPKSSNRRSYRMRQAMESEERDSNSNSSSSSNNDMVPRNLQQAFDNIMGAGEEPASASAAITAQTPEVTLSLPKLLPRRKILPPSTPSPTSSSPMISPASSSSSSSPMNKKSSSCPDLSQSNSTDKEDCQRQIRAKEQHNRRERRNKFTVFQRSMTLAQGWNNKGLQMAGKATRAEQYLQQEEQEQQQRQCSPNGNHEGDSNNAKELWESSLSCWDNALEIYRSLLGDSHERVADVQNNRGIALGKLGLFEDALGALEMALRARKKKHDDAKKNSASASHPDAAAIVSTLHNIANVYRDAKHWDEALNVLIEAELALRASQDDVLRQNNHTCQGDDVMQQQQQHHLHHCWHQSARLYTAIGHVYYESESWRNSRDAYVQALKVYEKLSRSLRTESNRLGWEGGSSRQRSGNRPSRQQQPSTPLSTSEPDEAKRLELLHHHQLIQQEVSILEQDLDELDRCQQAKEGGRARLLQVRQMQQQQQKQKQRTHHPQRRMEEQQPKQQQIKLRPPSSLLGIVNNNNNSLRT